MAKPHTPVTWTKRILLLLLLVFIVIQVIPKNRWSKDVAVEQSMAYMTNAPQEVADIMEVACNDCHTYETEYPWYANVAPVSFWIDDHINHGRKHLNFAEWASYSTKQQHHKFEECIEELKEGEMPLNSYTWLHGDAQLSEAQRSTLVEWFQTQMHSLSAPKEELQSLGGK